MNTDRLMYGFAGILLPMVLYFGGIFTENLDMKVSAIFFAVYARNLWKLPE